MENIAGTKSGLTWAVNITVIALVLIWLVPTVGLLVSSFRDRDQISASGWWQSAFAVDLNFRGRIPAADQVQEGDVWVTTGNVFLDPEVAESFPEGSGTIAAFGISGREPAKFAAGEVTELKDGSTISVAADGSFRVEKP